MLSDDLMTTIQRLPLDEKVALLEVLMRTVNEALHHASSEAAAAPATEHLADMLGGEGQPPPFAELRGVLAAGLSVSAGYDWKDDYTDYLTKKYA